MASWSVTLLVHLLISLIVINAILCKPVADSDAAKDVSLKTSDDAREPRMRPMGRSSPVFHAGTANVNGRFGKNIRAFTVNEFEKYIGGLM